MGFSGNSPSGRFSRCLTKEATLFAKVPYCLKPRFVLLHLTFVATKTTFYFAEPDTMTFQLSLIFYELALSA